jgi:hypothetical protein
MLDKLCSSAGDASDTSDMCFAQGQRPIPDLRSSAEGTQSTKTESSRSNKKWFDKMSESKPLKIIDSGCGNRYNNILFVPDDDLSKYYYNINYCKFCRQVESDKVEFLCHRKFICKKCASRESNFCRVRNVLV